MQSLSELVEKINNEFTFVVGGSYVSLDGEIFTEAEVKLIVQKRIEEFSRNNLEKIKRQSFKELGVIPEQVLINKRKKTKHTNNKSHYDGDRGAGFSIMYRDKIQEVINLKLEVNEKLVYYVVRDFIAYPSNCIMINEQIPTFKELEDLIGLKERTIRKALKSLEEKRLIKLVQSGHRKAIYVNPEYYASGKDLNIETLEMFGLVDCDKRKVESYIVE